jgi:hypothetical protein
VGRQPPLLCVQLRCLPCSHSVPQRLQTVQKKTPHRLRNQLVDSVGNERLAMAAASCMQRCACLGVAAAATRTLAYGTKFVDFLSLLLWQWRLAYTTFATAAAAAAACAGGGRLRRRTERKCSPTHAQLMLLRLQWRWASHAANPHDTATA